MCTLRQKAELKIKKDLEEYQVREIARRLEHIKKQEKEIIMIEKAISYKEVDRLNY